MGFSKDMAAGCQFLLQGIFLTWIKRESLASLHWQVDSLPLPPPGKPPTCLLSIDCVPNSSPGFLHVLTRVILTPALQ